MRHLAATAAIAALLAGGAATAQDSGGGGIGTVSITGGQAEGVPTDIEGVTVFKGLPYAGSAAGDARFAAPQPVEPWDGVKTADTWPDRSMHWSGINPVGEFYGDEFYYDEAWVPPLSEEGGLALNVFTPADSKDANLPVYVWFHGGANAHGYASEIEFWASKLAEKGIIVVSAQYRLGPFGAMALPALQEEHPEGAAGNQREQDLIAALEWVQENIAEFGGDPETVTIGGQSAGSRNVYAMLRALGTEDLFDRAVMQSTFRIGPDDTPTPEEAFEINEAALEEIFGEPTTVEDLRALPAERFFEPVSEENDTLLYYELRSQIEGNTLDGVVFDEESIDLLREGALDGIDIMTGATANERTSLEGGPDATMELAEYEAQMSETYGEGWEEAYPVSDPQHALRMSLQAGSDKVFAESLVSAMYAANHNEDGNVYAYYFDNPPPGRNAEYYGSFHSADLWYFFNSMRTEEGQRPWTEADFRMAETISTYLANFVKTGDPNGENLPEWPTADDGEFIRFADGYAYPVETTPYPSRDALNQALVLEQWGLSQEDIDG